MDVIENLQKELDKSTLFEVVIAKQTIHGGHKVVATFHNVNAFKIWSGNDVAGYIRNKDGLLKRQDIENEPAPNL